MLVRAVGIAAEFVKCNLKEFMADRGNFWTYLVTLFLYQALYIIFLSVIFAQVPTIKGWSFYQLLFVYGFFNIVSGLFYLVFSWTLWFSQSYIIDRQLDIVLTFPLNPYFFVLLQELGHSIMEIISVVLGTAIVIMAAVHLGITLSVWLIAQFLAAVLGGVLILGGLFSLLISVSFWVKGQASLVTPFMDILQFAQYPIDVYPRWLRVLLTFVIPIGFVGFYPVSAILGKSGRYLSFLTLLIGIVLFGGGYIFWNIGLRRYESAGS